MIRIDVNGIEVHLQPVQQIFDPKIRIPYVFLKDRETGQTVRVIRGSKEMTDFMTLITVEHGHGVWQIPACRFCEGDGVLEYLDMEGTHHTKPCFECLGYGVGVKEAA